MGGCIPDSVLENVCAERWWGDGSSMRGLDPLLARRCCVLGHALGRLAVVLIPRLQPSNGLVEHRSGSIEQRALECNRHRNPIRTSPR